MASIVSRRPFMEVNPERNLSQSLPPSRRLPDLGAGCRLGAADQAPPLPRVFSAEVQHG